MNSHAVRALARKDLRIALRNKGVLLPIIIVPLLMMILMPALMIFLPVYLEPMGAGEELRQEMGAFFTNMPAELHGIFAGLNDQQTWVVFSSMFMFAPFFLIIPLMVSSVIGADSFAGEKERKTLEALLYTPLTTTELFIGKVLAAFLPAVIVSWASFVLYTVVVNAAGVMVLGKIFFPNLAWLLLILWVVPAAAALGVGVIVLISAKAKSFQDAYQLSGLVVLPILLLLFGQMGGILYFSSPTVVLIGLGLWAVDAMLFYLAVRTFGRGEIIARL
ncbi:MAG: ABC transporter permease subunit [Anaerolineae bacterium]